MMLVKPIINGVVRYLRPSCEVDPAAGALRTTNEDRSGRVNSIDTPERILRRRRSQEELNPQAVSLVQPTQPVETLQGVSLAVSSS